MSRHLTKVLAAAIFVVALYCLIPVSSGADYTDSKPAHLWITIDIPDAAPSSDVQVPVVPDPEVIPATPPVVDKPNPGKPPSAQPNPPVVQPTVPDPVVQPDPQAPSDPTPAADPPASDPVAPQEPIVTEPQPDPQPSPTPIDTEGSSNEEISP